jgi:hypothetical protein
MWFARLLVREAASPGCANYGRLNRCGSCICLQSRYSSVSTGLKRSQDADTRSSFLLGRDVISRPSTRPQSSMHPGALATTTDRTSLFRGHRRCRMTRMPYLRAVYQAVRYKDRTWLGDGEPQTDRRTEVQGVSSGCLPPFGLRWIPRD